jgi:membrane protein
VLFAVNGAYGVTEWHPLLRFQAIGLSMTLAPIIGAMLAIGVLLLLPPAINFLRLERHGDRLIHVISLAMLIGFFFAVALLYRFGPSRPWPSHIYPGTTLAAILWLIASGALSFYVAHMSGFGATYGSLGTIIGLICGSTSPPVVCCWGRN